MIWLTHEPELLGLIPTFLSEDDPRGAVEQINEAYAHGGGWKDFKGFTLTRDLTLEFPDDPPLPASGATILRDELIVVYRYGWVVVKQRAGSFRVARID